MTGAWNGGIADEHVEWAVVSRLKAMLDEPPSGRVQGSLHLHYITPT